MPPIIQKYSFFKVEGCLQYQTSRPSTTQNWDFRAVLSSLSMARRYLVWCSWWIMKKLFFCLKQLSQTNNVPGDRGEPWSCHHLAHFLEVDYYQCQCSGGDKRWGTARSFRRDATESKLFRFWILFFRLLPILVWFEFRQSDLIRRILMLISSSGDQRQWQEWCLFIVFPINAAKNLSISSFRTKLRLCGTKLGCGEGGNKQHQTQS